MVGALGDQPQDVLRGAADEVLAWLKVSETGPQEGFHGLATEPRVVITDLSSWTCLAERPDHLT